MEYRVFDIDYDTEDSTVVLPQELILSIDDDSDPEESLADAISAEIGWCVNTFSFESFDLPRSFG